MWSIQYKKISNAYSFNVGSRGEQNTYINDWYRCSGHMFSCSRQPCIARLNIKYRYEGAFAVTTCTPAKGSHVLQQDTALSTGAGALAVATCLPAVGSREPSFEFL